MSNSNKTPDQNPQTIKDFFSLFLKAKLTGKRTGEAVFHFFGKDKNKATAIIDCASPKEAQLAKNNRSMLAIKNPEGSDYLSKIANKLSGDISISGELYKELMEAVRKEVKDTSDSLATAKMEGK